MSPPDSVFAIASFPTDDGRDLGPALPANPAAEQGLLGVLLIDNTKLHTVEEFLRPEHFYVKAHSRIYAAIAAAAERGEKADDVTLKTLFAGDPDFDHLPGGGADYLTDLVVGVVTVLNAEHYGRTIFGLHQRRQLIVLAEETARRARDMLADEAPLALLADFQTKADGLIALAERGVKEGGVKTFTAVLSDFLDSINPNSPQELQQRKILTGLEALDMRLGGLPVPSLVVVGARPSMGKTALLVTIMPNAVALSPTPMSALLFSIEQKNTDIAAKILARRTAISVKTMRSGQLMGNELDRIVTATREVAGLKLYIDDDPGIGIHQIRSRARRLKRQDPSLSIIGIDYLQLIESGAGDGENEERRLSFITRSLKKLAKDLDVSVILLSQLNREVEKRENKRPLLSDLRGSGSIEQDADIILFPYRHEYYLEKQKPRSGDFKKSEAFHQAFADWEAELVASRGQAEIDVAKARDAERGSEIMLRFDGARQVFEDFGGESMI